MMMTVEWCNTVQSLRCVASDTRDLLPLNKSPLLAVEWRKRPLSHSCQKSSPVRDLRKTSRAGQEQGRSLTLKDLNVLGLETRTDTI